jgi:ankyrin repeat protein
MSTSVLSVNCTDQLGHTPLHKACLVGERGLVELFLRHGALLDSRTKDNDQTPLHLACQYNQKDVSQKPLVLYASVQSSKLLV